MARVSQLRSNGSASISPARTAASMPHDRTSSMVRTLTPVALGNPDSSARRSTSNDATPWWASVIAVVRPAGPAPTINTGCLR